MKTRYKRTVLAGTIALTMCAGLSPPAFSASYVAEHKFTLDDLTGDLIGSTYGPDGLATNTSILCTSSPCGDALIYTDSQSQTTMYPIDSQFGFYVEDFVGAATKQLDGDYLEGHIGTIYEDQTPVGIAISNAKTDKFKVKYPMGTWCAGLGSNSVKCSTEHYSVLEHVLTCNETIPYFYVENPLSFPTVQAPLIDPEDGTTVVGSCAIGALVDDLILVENGSTANGNPLLPDPDTGWTAPLLPANESTVLDDIAVSSDYGITKKDDGKPLYRFGNFIKRPNDIRLYAKMPLPEAWKEEGADYEVTSAKLIIDHLITNNPNDQIRPEDMENEGATGRKPTYTVDGSGNWLSNRLCYEGDGDEIPLGTVFKNMNAAIPVPADGTLPVDGTPYPYSSDLVGGFSNGWYTSTDRDPFANVDSVDQYTTVSTVPGEAPSAGDLSNGGPRWRLKPNKFGQDIPGLEVPSLACSPVPYSSANIRYPVGVYTQTTINLLDWEVPGGSPLASSAGWVKAEENFQNYSYVSGTIGDDAVYENTGVNGPSINGAPLSDDFDLMIYIKGDRKATALYKARLEVEYEADDPPLPDPDLVMVSFTSDMANVSVGDTVRLTATVRSDYANDVTYMVHLAAYDADGQVLPLVSSGTQAINPGEVIAFTHDWSATSNNVAATRNVWWYARVYRMDDFDNDTTNNAAALKVRVEP